MRDACRYPLSITIGHNSSGEPYLANVSSMPHLFISYGDEEHQAQLYDGIIKQLYNFMRFPRFIGRSLWKARIFLLPSGQYRIKAFQALYQRPVSNPAGRQ